MSAELKKLRTFRELMTGMPKAELVELLFDATDALEQCVKRLGPGLPRGAEPRKVLKRLKEMDARRGGVRFCPGCGREKAGAT